MVIFIIIIHLFICLRVKGQLQSKYKHKSDIKQTHTHTKKIKLGNLYHHIIVVVIITVI
jgi:hypothetical protein